MKVLGVWLIAETRRDRRHKFGSNELLDLVKSPGNLLSHLVDEGDMSSLPLFDVVTSLGHSRFNLRKAGLNLSHEPTHVLDFTLHFISILGQ